MTIDFETFTLSCLRRRPAARDWIACMAHAALGLTSAAVALASLTSATRPPRSDVIDVLMHFEYARALLYHHADARPAATGASTGEPAASALVDLACRTGHVGHLVDAWIAGDLQARTDLALALDDLEVDRARTYAVLHLAPATVWMAAGVPHD